MIRIASSLLLLVTISALGQPVGKRIDIGGRSLHIVCMGSGDRTVVMESGAAVAFYEWWLVQNALRDEVRTSSATRWVGRSSSATTGDIHPKWRG